MTVLWKLGIAGENAGNKSKPKLHVCWISAVHMVEGLGPSFPKGPYGVQLFCGVQTKEQGSACMAMADITHSIKDISRKVLGASLFDIAACGLYDYSAFMTAYKIKHLPSQSGNNPIYPFRQLASPNDDQLQDFLFRADLALNPASLHR